MKVTKIIAGEYKVETEEGTYTVGRLHNSWDVWTGYPATNSRRWCYFFGSKREALEAIQEVSNLTRAAR